HRLSSIPLHLADLHSFPTRRSSDLEDVATRRALSKTQKMRRFFQTSYAAASWSKPRKVVARVEASEQGSDTRFIVTNLPGRAKRSEEHTSELQSRGHLVCRLLLEKK